MQISSIGENKAAYKKQLGFSLIEILVVVFIIATLLAIAGLSVANDSNRRHLESEAKRIYSLMLFANEQAMINGQELAIQINQGRYQFLKFDESNKKWKKLEKKAFEDYDLSSDYLMHLTLEGTPVYLDVYDGKFDPAIIFSSSGEVTPFSLSVGLLKRKESKFLIASNGIERISFSKLND